MDRNGNSGWRYRMTNDQTIQILDRGATNILSSTGIIPLNTWSSVGVAMDGAGLAIYINWKLDNSNGTAFGGGNSATLTIGVSGPHTEAWQGLIDAHWKWARRLSSSDFLWLHTEPYAFLLPQSPRRYFYGALAGGHAQALTATVVSVPSLSKRAFEAMAVTATVAPALTRLASFFRVLSVTATAAPSVSRLVSLARTLAVTVTAEATLAARLFGQVFQQSLSVVSTLALRLLRTTRAGRALLPPAVDAADVRGTDSVLSIQHAAEDVEAELDSLPTTRAGIEDLARRIGRIATAVGHGGGQGRVQTRKWAARHLKVLRAHATALFPGQAWVEDLRGPQRLD